MFLLTQLQDIKGEQLDLYMDWLLQEIGRCETETDTCSHAVGNEVFHRIKQRMLHQELRRHRRELRRVLNEKKRKDGFTGGVTDARQLSHVNGH